MKTDQFEKLIGSDGRPYFVAYLTVRRMLGADYLVAAPQMERLESVWRLQPGGSIPFDVEAVHRVRIYQDHDGDPE